MPTPELIALVIQGGAVVALLAWVWDLRAQRKYQEMLRLEERRERLESAAILRTVGDALRELTSAIDALVDGPPTRKARP
jgi:hypothetical protein